MFPSGALFAMPTGGSAIVGSGNLVTWLHEVDGVVNSQKLFELPAGHLISVLTASSFAANLACQRVVCGAGNYLFVATARPSGGIMEWSVELVFRAPSRLCALELQAEDRVLCVTCTNVASLIDLHPVGQQVAAMVAARCGLSYAASISGDLVFCGSYSGHVLAWRWRSGDGCGAAEGTIANQHKPGSVIYSLCARHSPEKDCTFVATASDDRTACLSALRSGEQVGSILWRSDVSIARLWTVDLIQHSIEPSPAGTTDRRVLLAAGGEEGSVRQYILSCGPVPCHAFGALLQRLDSCHRGGGCTGVCWTSNGALVSAGASGSVLFHPNRPGAAGGRKFHPLTNVGEKIRIRCILPLLGDGTTVIALCTDKPQLLLMDATTGGVTLDIALNRAKQSEAAGKGRPCMPTSLVASLVPSDGGVTLVIGTNIGTITTIPLIRLHAEYTTSGPTLESSLGPTTASVLCMACVWANGLGLVATAVAADGRLHVVRPCAQNAVAGSVKCWDGPAGTAVALITSGHDEVLIAAGAKGGLVHMYQWNGRDAVLVEQRRVALCVDRPVQSLIGLRSRGTTQVVGWRAVAGDGSWLDVDFSGEAAPFVQKLPWQVSSIVHQSEEHFLVSLSNCTLSVHERLGEGLWTKTGQVDDVRAPRLFGAASSAELGALVIAHSPDGASVFVDAYLPTAQVVCGGLSGKDLNAVVSLSSGFVTAGEDTSLYVVCPNGSVTELHGGHRSNILALATSRVADDSFVLSAGGRNETALWCHHACPATSQWKLLFTDGTDDDGNDSQAVPRVLCAVLRKKLVLEEMAGAFSLQAILGLSDGRVCVRSWDISQLRSCVSPGQSEEVVPPLSSPIFCMCPIALLGESASLLEESASLLAVGCGNGKVHILDISSRLVVASAVLAACAVNCITIASVAWEKLTANIVCGTDGGEVVISEYSQLCASLVALNRCRVSITACRSLLSHPSTCRYVVFVSDASVAVVDAFIGKVVRTRHLSIRGVAHGSIALDLEGPLAAVRVTVVGRGVEVVRVTMEN